MSTLIRYYLVLFLLIPFLNESSGQTISADHFFRQGGHFQDHGDLSLAVDYYTEALKLNEKNPLILFNRALAYYHLDKPHKALYDLNSLLELSPSDAEAFEFRAEIYTVLDQVDKALADYSRAILLQPNVNRYLNRALLQAQQEQFILALKDVDQALHLNPTDAASHTVKADILVAQGKLGSAIKGYSHAIALDQQTSKDLAQQLPIETSTNTSILLNKAFYLIGKGQLDATVLEQLEKSSRSTDKAFAFYCLGLINLRQKDYHNALSDFNKALAMDQALGEYYYARGVALTYLHRFEEAQLDFGAATQLGFVMDEKENWLRIPAEQEQYLLLNEEVSSYTMPTNTNLTPEVQFLVNRGFFLSNTGNFEEAIVMFNQAIHLDPDCYQAYLQKGKAQEKLDWSVKAIESYSVAIALNPGLAEGLYYRAMLYFNKQNWNLAKDDLDRIIKQQPNHANAFYMRAQCHAKMKQWHAALKDYNIFLDKYPQDALAYNNRGAVKMSLGLAFQALEDFNFGISLDDKNPALFVNRARVKSQMGAFAEALLDYNIALKYRESNPVIYYERGLINMKLHRYPQAIQDYTEAIKLDESETADYYYERALAFQIANAPEAAIVDYNTVLKLDNNRAEALYNRGIAKHILEDHLGADSDLSLAAQMGKNSPNDMLSRQ